MKPGQYKKYLTCTKSGLVREANWMYDGRWCLDMSGCNYFFPTHWMPLPEPPAKEGEEELPIPEFDPNRDIKRRDCANAEAARNCPLLGDKEATE